MPGRHSERGSERTTPNRPTSPWASLPTSPNLGQARRPARTGDRFGDDRPVGARRVPGKMPHEMVLDDHRDRLGVEGIVVDGLEPSEVEVAPPILNIVGVR